MKAHFLSALALFALLGPGCYRYQTQVPGVVDLRSDASGAERVRPRRPNDDDVARGKGVAILVGEGVTVDGARVQVEERHVFLRGLVPVWNTSAAEEIEAAVALSGALRDVELREEYGPIDVGLGLLVSFLPVAGWLIPSTFTFALEGEAVRVERRRPWTTDDALPLPSPFDDLPPPPPLEELP